MVKNLNKILKKNNDKNLKDWNKNPKNNIQKNKIKTKSSKTNYLMKQTE